MFLILPTDIFFEIGKYLSTKDISYLLQTCKQYNLIYTDLSFWEMRQRVLSFPIFSNVNIFEIDFALTVKQGICIPVEYNGRFLTSIFLYPTKSVEYHLNKLYEFYLKAKENNITCYDYILIQINNTKDKIKEKLYPRSNDYFYEYEAKEQYIKEVKKDDAQIGVIQKFNIIYNDDIISDYLEDIGVCLEFVKCNPDSEFTIDDIFERYINYIIY